jgi:hypothetical protein
MTEDANQKVVRMGNDPAPTTDFLYNGWRIYLNDHYTWVLIPPEGVDKHSESYFDTVYKAKAFVDAYHKAAERTTKRRISIVCRAGNTGDTVTIRGVNGNTSKVLGITDRDVFFPDVMWITVLLQERARLRRRDAYITRLISPFHISPRRGYGTGRLETDAQYNAKVDALEEEINRKTRDAREHKNANGYIVEPPTDGEDETPTS